MDYSINASPDDKYVILNIKGNVTRRSMSPVVFEAHRLGHQLNVHCYLVDLLESRNIETVVDNYEFANVDMRYPDIDQNACVAFLVSPEDHSHDFVETVSRNAGMDITIFTDRNKAIQHLLERQACALS